MTEVISVRFRGGCKSYYFDPQGAQVRMGDNVIVETAQGLEFATVTQGNHQVEDGELVKALSPMVRVATENDRRTVEYNRKREREAFRVCEDKIAAHGLEMKLVSVSCAFDGNKIIFFFTADGRVDFRELVRDLASVFRSRIELRQIGVRDEAKMIGGLGICGRPFCCSQFLDGFLPVSIKMAKTQSLSLNPTKISGTCGRLMCCLKYEQNAYEDAAKRMPKNDSFVQTPDGPGNVKSVDLLRGRVKVALDDAAPSDQLKTYRSCEIKVLRNGKGSRDGIDIPERTQRYVEPMEEREGDEDIPAVISTPFYMNRLAGEAAAAEDAPVREKIGGPSGADKRRRPNRRNYRSGEGRPDGGGQAKQNQPRQEGQPRGEGQSRRQGQPRQQGQSQQGQRQEDGARRRRPHHRGGRKRKDGDN